MICFTTSHLSSHEIRLTNWCWQNVNQLFTWTNNTVEFLITYSTIKSQEHKRKSVHLKYFLCNFQVGLTLHLLIALHSNELRLLARFTYFAIVWSVRPAFANRGSAVTNSLINGCTGHSPVYMRCNHVVLYVMRQSMFRPHPHPHCAGNKAWLTNDTFHHITLPFLHANCSAGRPFVLETPVWNV